VKEAAAAMGVSKEAVAQTSIPGDAEPTVKITAEGIGLVLCVFGCRQTLRRRGSKSMATR
jgi:hypothetical protein